MTTGILKNADGSTTLTAQVSYDEAGAPLSLTVPAGAPVGPAAQAFFAHDLAVALNTYGGYPIDLGEAFMNGSVAALP